MFYAFLLITALSAPSLMNSTMFLSLTVVAIMALIPALILLPLGVRHYQRVSKIVVIAGTAESITIDELSRKTGFDHDYTLTLLRDAILSERLFGKIENDETFIRYLDAVHPRRYDGASY
jgi:hypothetical protein